MAIMSSGVKTLALGLWAPALAGLLATAVTWLVWYYTALPCTPENAVALKCQPSLTARYLSTAVLHHCIIHTGIAVTITGGSDLMLFLRERQRNEQEKQRNELERQRNDRMMELFSNAIAEAAEERKQAAEERRQAAAQAALERQAFLDALNNIANTVVQFRQNRE